MSEPVMSARYTDEQSDGAWLCVYKQLLHDFENATVMKDFNSSLLQPFIYFYKHSIKEVFQRVDRSKVNEYTISQSLEEILTKRLNSLLMKTLMFEVTIAGKVGILKGDTKEERYQDYIQQFVNLEKIRSFYELYPVLARLMTEETIRFLTFSKEIIIHVDKDMNQLQQTFTGEYDCLKDVSIGLGDTHNYGRSVAKLTFVSGSQLMYKPHSLAVDECFQEIVRWINNLNWSYPLKAAQVLNYGSYGYQQYITNVPCNTLDETERFYYRQGAYTALFYVLGSVDLHCENLIACGEHPVFVDMETLFSQLTDVQLKLQAPDVVYSVFRSMVIPGIYSRNNLFDVEISAVGGRGGQQSQSIMYERFEQMGTDDVQVVMTPYVTEENKNRPSYDNQWVDPVNYVRQMTTGFRKLYELLWMHREQLIPCVLQSYADVHVRQIFRPTQVYAKFLMKSTHPDYLQTGTERSRLLKLFTQAEEISHIPKAIIQLEIEQLQRHDVPYFTFVLNSRNVYTVEGHSIKEIFPYTGLEILESRLKRLSREDMEKQLQYMRWSLISLLEKPWHSQNMHRNMLETAATNESDRIGKFERIDTSSVSTKLDPDMLIQKARAIADELLQHTISNEEKKELGWIGLNIIGKYVKPGIIGKDLYNGELGYLLFFAQLASVTGDEKYTSIAHLVMKTLRNSIASDTIGTHERSISAFYGESALIYGFVYCGILWDDDELLQEAKKHLWLLQDTIVNTEKIDFIDGYAGAILVLMRVYESLQDEDYLFIAYSLGNRLLERLDMLRQWGGEKRKVYLNDEPLLTGLSHGASGMAWALCSLGAASYREEKGLKEKVMDSEKCWEMVWLLLHYENAHFISEYSNWADLREDSGSLICQYWCHGAPGIALARIHMYKLLHANPTPSLEQMMMVVKKDYDAAVDALKRYGKLNNHSLCHGTLGNADIMLTLSQLIQEKELADIAGDWVSQSLLEQEEQGWIGGLDPRVEMDGLMLGRVGFGYSCLRFIDPIIPSVLALELPKIK